MSRNKKSRKPPTAPKAKAKLSKEALASVDKRVRKKTGKTPGNRQQEALQGKDTAATAQKNKDPRIGNKTPIALGGLEAKAEKKVSKQKQSKVTGQDAIAAIRYVEPTIDSTIEAEQNLAQELAAIEADEKLQAILAKQDEEIALTEQEVDYFNDMMERHQLLTEKLAVDEEEGDDSDTPASKSSEDDLWNKLDNASDDFSQFE